MVGEDDNGGDQVPDVHRNDVGGEEVDLIENVGALGVVVTAELAEVSSAVA
jgi:hypothetical protein